MDKSAFYAIRDKIKGAIKLSEYVKRHVNLKEGKYGEYVGLCPFHREKTPSFGVSDNKGLWHCFGCGASGDVIGFVMKINNVEYGVALRSIGEEIGIKVSFRSSDDNLVDPVNKFFQINRIAADWYHDCLFSSYGEAALAYLEKRGISLEVIKKYKIGYSPHHEKLVNGLLENFSQDDITQLKVFSLKDGKWYSQFYKRIIFPIFDTYNKIAGFGGRVIENRENSPKYINSYESDIFQKGSLFYGLNIVLSERAEREKIKDSGKKVESDKSIVIVEGYIDVLSLVTSGVKNVVAPLGTALQVQQVMALWNNFDDVILCFDNDVGGINGMLRLAKAILPVLRVDKEISFLLLPETVKDPDEFISKYGLSDWEKLQKKRKVSLADFLFYSIYNKHRFPNSFQLADISEKAKAQKELFSLAGLISDKSLKYEYNSYFFDLLVKYKKNLRKKFKNIVSFDRDIHYLFEMDFDKYFEKIVLIKGIEVNDENTDVTLESDILTTEFALLFYIIMKNPYIRSQSDFLELFCDFRFTDPIRSLLHEIIILNHDSTASSLEEWLALIKDLNLDQSKYNDLEKFIKSIMMNPLQFDIDDKRRSFLTNVVDANVQSDDVQILLHKYVMRLLKINKVKIIDKMIQQKLDELSNLSNIQEDDYADFNLPSLIKQREELRSEIIEIERLL